MPEQENAPEPQQRLKQDPLVEKLIPDLSEKHPDVRVLSGFLGNSSQKGHWRLYLTPALDVYLEIPEEDIVHSQSLASEGNSLGGTILWVKQDADVELHTRTNLRQRQVQLLTGGPTATGFAQTGQQGMTTEEAASLAAFRSRGVSDPAAILGSWICPQTGFLICPNPRPRPPDNG